MKILSLLPAISFALLASCTEKKPVDRMTDEQLRAYADSLAHRFIITDGHIDLPYRLKESGFQPVGESLGIPVSSKGGDFDFERARKGGLDAPFMSIYIPSSNQKVSENGELLGGGKELADSLINMIRGIVDGIPDKFALANTPSEIEKNFLEGKISLPMGMENGAPIGKDIANLKYFFDRGIRYITLTHGKDNQICDSSYDTLHTWNGLSPFGSDVVAEMNRLGIMIDISHVDDNSFFQVMEITKAPCIASHSSCRYFTPTFKRNMSDEMIERLALNGGVIQINFGSTFLDSMVAKQNTENRETLRGILKEKNLRFSDSLARPLIEQFRKDHPSLYADVETVANHIEHVVTLVGIDHVGLGSDFDGVGDSLPTGLKDVSMYPNLIYALLKRGYTEEEIEKICSGNVFRVWNQVISVASGIQNTN